MLIVCPSCASQYTIDPAKVGTDGRIVRCARCRTTWFAASDPMADGSSIPAKWQERQSGDGPGPTISVEARSERLRPEEAHTGAEAVPPAAQSIAKPRARSEGVQRRPVGFPIGVAALVLVLAIIAVAGRTSIVRAFPGTARLYASAGWPVNLRGLAFADVRSEIAASDERPILVVEGEIRNVARGEVGLPPIQIAVRAADGQALYTWTDDPPRKTLKPGEAARFRARLAAPPAEGRDVLVRFDTATRQSD
jgi:predicted Zn finger-like uncharacterized protein